MNKPMYVRGINYFLAVIVGEHVSETAFYVTRSIITLTWSAMVREWKGTSSYSPFGWKNAFENIFDI